MIESRRLWHSQVVQLRSATFLLPLLLVLACDAEELPNQDNNDEESMAGDQPCDPPRAPVPVTYSVSLVGFPEIENNALVGDENLSYSGACTLDEMDFAGDQLTMSLACEHPSPSDPEGARVTIVTAALGLPEGVEVGDVLNFEASVILLAHTGGFTSGPIFRAVTDAGPETYELSDEDGLVFGAKVNGLSANFEPIMINREYNCPEWMPCSEQSPDPIAAHVLASVNDSAIEVYVGDVAPLSNDELVWTLSLFEASLNDDCHDGETGGFSVVRRPE